MEILKYISGVVTFLSLISILISIILIFIAAVLDKELEKLVNYFCVFCASSVVFLLFLIVFAFTLSL